MSKIALSKKTAQKCKVKAKKPHPNKKTAWAYYMQAIEPKNKQVNEAFPEYHPMWIVQSQRENFSPERFKYLRQYVMNISQEQCAAYLRVAKTTIMRWENKKATLPFSAFEALRLLIQTVHYKLASDKWQGWFVTNDGRLVSPDRGNLSFAPDELSSIREIRSFYESTRTENMELKAEIALLKIQLSNSSGHKVVPISMKSSETQTTRKVKAA